MDFPFLANECDHPQVSKRGLLVDVFGGGPISEGGLLGDGVSVHHRRLAG